MKQRARVVCTHCRQDLWVDEIELINVQEDIQGRDLGTFHCTDCNQTFESYVRLVWAD